MILEHGAKIDHKNIDGFSAFMHAVMAGHVTIIGSLLAHGADRGLRENGGWTALMLAAQFENIQVAQLLIDHGEDVNYESYNHWTPLTVAAARGNTATTDGQTALHWAASYDHQQIIRLLLDAGADPSVRDFRDRTAAHVAMMEGYFTTAELLEPAGTTAMEYEDKIWSRSSLLELYAVGNVSEQDVEAPRHNPPWFIDRSSIISIEPCPHLTTAVAQVSVGTWLGSRVVIVEPAITIGRQHGVDITMMQRSFQRELSKLYPLRHPHVIRLYGACHRGDNPFLVMEHAANGNLRAFVAEQKHRTWAILHEVALGVQYLDERGIIHESLKCEDILIGDDGLVKLSAFGVYSMSRNGAETLLWDPAEVVVHDAKRSSESNVYSLGMCIIEAVSGKLPYTSDAAEKRNVKELISAGVPPNRPAALSDRGWDLVMQMICLQSSKRLKISDVVRELAALAQDEDLEATRVTIEGGGATCSLDSGIDMEETFAHGFSVLNIHRVETGKDTREIETEFETPESLVLHRLHHIWQVSERLPPSSLELLQPRLQGILTRFTTHAQAQASMNLAASFAAQRQHADCIFSFHNEIDHLLEEQGAASTSSMMNNNVYSWRDRWHTHRRVQLQALGAWLGRVEELDVETCTCLLFELSRRRDAYTSIPLLVIQEACSKLRLMPGVRVPDWFIPHYEVVFDAFKSFSRGAFGSVHRGEWMGSLAVIKKVFADDESEFQKEVDIWSRLYHPHVLQLFGACHVGQKFIISEFAEHGQLDHYLRRLEKQPAKREREVWRALYEAALGLQYLHSCGVVHCDLKCNNILIGRDGKAKVSDYGLSRVRDQLQHPDDTDELALQHKPGSPVESA